MSNLERFARIWSLDPFLKHHHWAHPSFIPQLLGMNSERPVAEAWFGAHPEGPALATGPEGKAERLDALIAAAPEAWLGRELTDRFGTLPYLFKVLAAGRPLSIQVHPGPSEAVVGFGSEEAAGVARDHPDRVYRDARHKPELFLALTDAHALCGFRSFEDIARQVAAAPELRALFPPFEPTPDGLREALAGWFAHPEGVVEAALRALLDRLRNERAEAERSFEDPARWLLFAERSLGFAAPDRGLLFVLLLQIVHLAPGEGIYLDAGVPHAYLMGSGVEVMANSDNVLRAGLTSKRVVPEAFLAMARLQPGTPPILRPHAAGKESTYLAPVEEFAVSRLDLETGDRVERAATGPETLFVYSEHEGQVRLAVEGEKAQLLGPGRACLLPHASRYRLEAEASPVTVFRVSVPSAPDDVGFLRAIERNIEAAEEIAQPGRAPAVVGIVSGSREAQAFWQAELDAAREALGVPGVLSFHEDLPVNQAFGLLLMWKRMRSRLTSGEGALMAFVFGEGTRASPFTEAEMGQKPALLTGGRSSTGRPLSIAELALRAFLPVEAHLRRSGFDGVVVKWGDEILIPTFDLARTSPALAGADVVRFVSVIPIDTDNAANKDWVGIDQAGQVTAFIPRRPLAEMEALAEQGWVQRRGDRLYGGVNLGSIGLSRVFLDALLEEFETEVMDPSADRKQRPDLDPQFFTALTIAHRPSPEMREEAWARALSESAAMRRLEANLPHLLERLVGVLERFELRHGRRVRMMAMDFRDQYWGDIGQHRKIHEFYLALRDPGAAGRIARALVGLQGELDVRGNLLIGDVHLGVEVEVYGSVLVNVRVGSGRIEDSVLIGTRAEHAETRDAFDIESTVPELILPSRAGSYRVLERQALSLSPGERATTMVLPETEVLLRVSEDADLRNKPDTYQRPVHGNAMSFEEAHARAVASDPAAMRVRRAKLRRALEAELKLPG